MLRTLVAWPGLSKYGQSLESTENSQVVPSTLACQYPVRYSSLPQNFASSLPHLFPVSTLASLTFENQVAEMKTGHITSTCRNSPLSGHQKVQYTDQYLCRCVLKI